MARRLVGAICFTSYLHPAGLKPFVTLDWAAYSSGQDQWNHVFGLADASVGTSVLSFLGTRMPSSDSLLAAGNSLRARFVSGLLQYRSAILGHLSAITLFLGFHTLGLYVHNDVMQAFGTPEFEISLSPVFGQWLQVAHGQQIGSPLSCGDVLVYHAIALGDQCHVLVSRSRSLKRSASRALPVRCSSCWVKALTALVPKWGSRMAWATGFMFLISWRGYWQELIESIVWAHEQTPLANLIVWADKPIALSIAQARFVGLAHFAIGYVLTYGPFVMASSSSYT